jgi:UDP-N-acetylmuramoyl-tripeptide--D-alanyl-D-alanine ligase
MTTSQFKPLLTPDFVVRNLHLKIPVLPRPNSSFTKVTTDSRQIAPGCLFVALKGEKFDGHEFIDSAISQGARGVLFKRGTPVSTAKEICLFPVEDPLVAYRRLAAAWRREFSIPLIVVAGSVGKTTTKELLAAVLKGKWKNVLKTQGSQNGYVGIPMTLLELRPEHEVVVIEVGIDEIGAMQEHMNLIGANGAILTAIGPEHLVNLRDIPTIAREEGIALSTVARTGGTVAVNLDDPWIRPHATILREGRKIPFSLRGVASDLDMISGYVSNDGKTLTFQGLGIEPTTLPLPLLGNHNAANLLGAIAIAAGFGMTAEEIQDGLKTFKGAEGRSELRELPGPTPVVCDYYNAQPASVEAGLDLLAQISHQAEKRAPRWACLGDMLELGEEEERFHRELADKILNLGIENVLLFGPRMLALFQELEARGFQGQKAHFDTHQGLASALTQGVKPGEAILIKGSRGMRMEEVWKILEPYAKSNWKQPSPESKDSSKNSLPYP